MATGLSEERLLRHLARANDCDAIGGLYAACRESLASMGSDQWSDGYPTLKHVDRDIAESQLWCFSNQDIVAVGVLNQDQDSQHETIPWQGDYASCRYVHRLAVHPLSWGKGIGTFAMKQLELIAVGQGAKSMRLDTYSLNPSNLKFYQNLGYNRLEGEIFFPSHKAPFICFEKML